MPPVHLIFERIPRQLGKRLRISRQSLQFAVRHAGIILRQPPSLALRVKKGLVQMGHSPRILRAASFSKLPPRANCQAFKRILKLHFCFKDLICRTSPSISSGVSLLANFGIRPLPFAITLRKSSADAAFTFPETSDGPAK